MKNNSNFFTKRFYSTTILGLVFIILNIILDLSLISEIEKITQSKTLSWILMVLSKIFSTVGLALLLGNLTRYFTIKDEEEKENKRKEEIREITERTIISKDFLNSISNGEKKNIIVKLLKPDNNALDKHSNIEEYLENKTGIYLKFFNRNFRSHMNIDIKVLYDKEKQKFKAEYSIIYRIYKINKKYEPICIFSEKEHDYLNTIIKDSSGKELCNLSGDNLEKEHDKYYYHIPEEFNEFNFLTVERKITEYGYSHWISINWRSLTPIEGIRFKLFCENGVIKEHQIFDNEELYSNPVLSKDKRTLSINSSQWLDPYTGISIIVSNTPSENDLAKKEVIND